MKTFVVVLAESDAAALAPLRAQPGLQAARLEGAVWLRGDAAEPQVPVAVRQLPARCRYWLQEKDLLFLPGALTPERRLPVLDWAPLTEFLPVSLPVSALPARLPDALPIRLRASGRAEKSAALLSDWAEWATYAHTAPATRLLPLRFAASARQQALILGEPLPPLRGREYWLQGNLLLPCGFDFEYPVLAELIQAKYLSALVEYLLFDETGNWEELEAGCLVSAHRSAIRMTQP
ncbi:MAG: hypothetical protein IT260_08840 [Saprospiraceae bacterium]|nr:hypothetical protein [Saprospiraceae bacterium]